MSSTIANSFSGIVSGTALTEADREVFERRRGEVSRSLGRVFSISKFVTIGSYDRGSAVRGESDLDLLAVLRREDIWRGTAPKSSDTVLKKVRDAAQQTFRTTAIGKDGQAVVVAFGDHRTIDIVPGWWHSALPNGWPRYMIPDGGGGWLATAPDSHAKYIADGDLASGGKLKSVARILKYWRVCRATPLPLSAFHLELLLTANSICAPGKTLAVCVRDALSVLKSRACRALQDPCRVSGLISAAGTDAQRDRLLTGVIHSSEKADSAVLCEARGDETNAHRYWDMVFNGRFP